VRPVEMHLRLLLKKVNEKWKLRPLRRQRRRKEKEKFGNRELERGLCCQQRRNWKNIILYT
jgi:hypothetical protein